MPIAPLGTDIEYLDDDNYWKEGSDWDPAVIKQKREDKKALKNGPSTSASSGGKTRKASQKRTSGAPSKRDQYELLAWLEQVELEEQLEKIESDHNSRHSSATSYFDTTTTTTITSSTVTSSSSASSYFSTTLGEAKDDMIV